MRHILSTRQVVGTFHDKDEELEVCATGEAEYDDSRQKLILELDSFARTVVIGNNEQHRRLSWMPVKRQISESISAAEASDLARDVFHRWARTVRQAIPLASQNATR